MCCLCSVGATSRLQLMRINQEMLGRPTLNSPSQNLSHPKPRIGGEDPMYKRILVAMDGGAASELALEQAMIIARAANAEVEVVHVVDDRSPFLDVSNLDPVRLLEDLTTAGEGVLAAAASRLAASGIRHVTRMLGKPTADGDVATAIATEANGWGADLVVMGTHGRRGVRRLVMGSVARSVITLAVAPVLLVRAEET